MLWVLAGFVLHTIELSLITYAIKDIGPFALTALFYMFSAAFLFVYNNVKNKGFKLKSLPEMKQHKKLLSIYIASGLIGNILWFGSLFLIGIGPAAFILLFNRVFVTAYSYFFMNDRYPRDKLLAISTVFMALMLFSFSGEHSNLFGVLIGMFSCLFFTIEKITQKKVALTQSDPNDVITLRSILIATATFILYLIVTQMGLNDYPLPDLPTLGIIASCSLMGGVLFNIFIIYGLREVQLSFTETLNAIKPIILAVVGSLFFAEILTPFQVSMGGIIVISALYFLWPRKQTSKQQKPSNS